MPMQRKTAKQIMLAGNPSNLSKAELASRMSDETDTAPTVQAGRPRMPCTLTELEQQCWKQAAKIMRARGTLSKGDSENLEMYAVVKARWILARRDIEARGLEITETRHAKNGEEYEVSVPNPSLKICDSCEQRLHAYTKVLGLTPMDRTKVKKTKASDNSYQPKPGTVGAEFAHLFDENGRLKPHGKTN
jgi:P27 family predicted phage terminase small subunit